MGRLDGGSVESEFRIVVLLTVRRTGASITKLDGKSRVKGATNETTKEEVMSPWAN